MAGKKVLRVPYLPLLEAQESADGVRHLLDDKGCVSTISEVNWAAEYPYRPLTTFSVGHSGQSLYIDFLVRCNFLRAVNEADQSPVSQDSCVEFFVSPRSDGRYWNFEFNCIGAINASHRVERRNPTRLTSAELAMVRRYASCGDRPFCELEGLFVWSLLVVIPLELIGVEYKGEPVNMTGNFYKCASATSQPHYLSWNAVSAPRPDFHRPECFGDIILV